MASVSIKLFTPSPYFVQKPKIDYNNNVKTPQWENNVGGEKYE
jgi:hypothetical protein